MFSCKFAAYFQNTFFLEHLWWKASVYCDKLALLSWEMGLRKGHLLLTLNKRHALPCFYWWFRVCFIPHKNKLLSRLLRIKYLSNSFYWFNISSKPCINQTLIILPLLVGLLGFSRVCPGDVYEVSFIFVQCTENQQIRSPYIHLILSSPPSI